MSVPKAAALAKASDWTTVFPLDTDAWTAFTPTLTQSVTVTKTVTYAAYTKVGRLVICNLYLTVTGAGTAANAVLIGLPIAASASGPMIGSGMIYDASVPLIHMGVAVLNGSVASLYIHGGTGVFAGSTGGIFTAALASSDQVRISVVYESAS